MKIIGCTILINEGGYVEIENGDTLINNHFKGNYSPDRSSSMIIDLECEDVEIPKSLVGQVVINKQKYLKEKNEYLSTDP